MKCCYIGHHLCEKCGNEFSCGGAGGFQVKQQIILEEFFVNIVMKLVVNPQFVDIVFYYLQVQQNYLII